MTLIDDLKKPSAENEARSAALSTLIQNDIIARGGAISFSAFMGLALYHPNYGYYNNPHFTIGKAGDFTTAPEISPLFARSVAPVAREIITKAETENILELGAGTGRFAVDLLKALQASDTLPRHYFIYEISDNLRRQQQTLLETACPELIDRLVFLDALPETFSGLIFANEVLDALPVDLFRIEDGLLKERVVAWRNHQFCFETRLPLSPMTVPESSLKEGYESEIHTHLAPFIRRLSHCLKKGVMLFADYGYGRCEYYRAERSKGTLTSFYQHQQIDHPLLSPGLIDITSHVDFTSVIEAAHEAGCALLGFTTQAGFLLENGLLDLAKTEEERLDIKGQIHLHQAIKTLTLPTEMGDRIKIMGLAKAYPYPISGFSFQDRRRDL